MKILPLIVSVPLVVLAGCRAPTAPESAPRDANVNVPLGLEEVRILSKGLE